MRARTEDNVDVGTQPRRQATKKSFSDVRSSSRE